MVHLIYLMRHGQSVVNIERRLTCRKPDGDLTDLGREQAAKAGDWLADKGITRLLHSPFHRAEQTAQIVAPKLKLTPVMVDDLREMDCGSLERRTDDDAWGEFMAVFRRWKKGDWEATYPGGESYRQGFERFSRCLNAVTETTLLVTHGGISIAVVPYLCVNAAALQGVGDLDNTGLVVLEPYDSGRYICRSWNLIEHLG
ncbi:MAG: histidine phosphatase family protein [Anaerolineae bacterium]|nr:histidine phosphatase family protein [Anaerolineae bacterium]